jgi:hypothetical protein
VRMRILFTETDDDGQSRFLLIIVCLLFFSPLPCCCPRRRRRINFVSAVFRLIFFPTPLFLFAAGRCIISSIVLNSLSQRHDNLYLSSQVNSGQVSGPVACRGLEVEQTAHFRSVLSPSPPSAVSPYISCILASRRSLSNKGASP